MVDDKMGRQREILSESIYKAGFNKSSLEIVVNDAIPNAAFPVPPSSFNQLGRTTVQSNFPARLCTSSSAASLAFMYSGIAFQIRSDISTFYFVYHSGGGLSRFRTSIAETMTNLLLLQIHNQLPRFVLCHPLHRHLRTR